MIKSTAAIRDSLYRRLSYALETTLEHLQNNRADLAMDSYARASVWIDALDSTQYTLTYLWEIDVAFFPSLTFSEIVRRNLDA